MHEGRHEPNANERYDVTDVGAIGEAQRYRIEGMAHGKPISGTLTLKSEGGEYDGWNWQGSTLDEAQSLLDLFAE